MADWFRSWHGAPTDPKWVLIGRKAKCTPAVASAVGWALFDCASQAETRGDVSRFDAEAYAAWAGLKEETVARAIAAMVERGMIAGGRLSAWESRQRDNSTERTRAWRDRKKQSEVAPSPQANGGNPRGGAPVTPVTPVTFCDAIESESEPEPEERREDRGAGPARASLVEGSSLPVGPPQRDVAAERSLEAECRARVDGLPAAVAVNFVPILRLLDAGMTREDILSGIDQALAKGVVPRGWSVFENFVREAAKDRIERGLAPRLRLVGGEARAGPREAPLSPHMAALTKLYAEAKAREEGLTNAAN
jgi:hypothetical protein